MKKKQNLNYFLQTILLRENDPILKIVSDVLSAIHIEQVNNICLEKWK